jgi:hypothetical protein
MELYRALKPLRGTRLYAHSAASDPDTDAIFEVVHNTEASAIVLALANFEVDAVPLALVVANWSAWQSHAPGSSDPSDPPDTSTWGVQVLDSHGLRAVPPPTDPASVRLPPQSLIVVVIPVREDRTASAWANSTEHYAVDVMAPAVDPNASRAEFRTTVPISGPVPSAAVATLRVGFKGDSVRCPSWSATVDGVVVLLNPTLTFRNGGCPARTANCSTDLADGRQTSWGDFDLAGWTPHSGNVSVHLTSCELDFPRSAVPNSYLSFLSILVTSTARA